MRATPVSNLEVFDPHRDKFFLGSHKREEVTLPTAARNRIEPGASVGATYKPWVPPDSLAFSAREKVKIIRELVERHYPKPTALTSRTPWCADTSISMFCMSTSESGANEYTSQCRSDRLRVETISTLLTMHDVRNLSVAASATRLIFHA